MIAMLDAIIYEMVRSRQPITTEADVRAETERLVERAMALSNLMDMNVRMGLLGIPVYRDACKSLRRNADEQAD